MEKLGGWRWRDDVTTGATTKIQRTAKVGDGERWYVESVHVLNSKTSVADCLVSVERGSTRYPLYYFTDLELEEWQRAQVRVWLFERECLRFDWSDVASDDVVSVVVHGTKRLVK